MPRTTPRCSWCLKCSASCLVCARCKVHSYCSKLCQKQAWKAKHKKECVVATPAAGSADLTLIEVLAGRAASLRLQKFATERNWDEVLALESVVMSHATSEPITATHCIIFGDAHHVKGDWAKALSYYQKFESMSEADLDNTERLGMAYGNTGMIHGKFGEFCKAIEYTQKALQIAKRFENRTEQARAYCHLAVYHSKQGDFVQAIKFDEECLQVCTEDDDMIRNKAFNNLGVCHLQMHQYKTAAAYFRKYLLYAQSSGHEFREALGAMFLGITLKLDARATRLELAARSQQVPDPRRRLFEASRKFKEEPRYTSKGPKFGRDGEAPARSPELLDQMVHKADHLLLAASDYCETALLHRAQLYFEAGDTDDALELLKEYLTLAVKDARAVCDGCGQVRCEDTCMLTCGSCRVARFCSVEHQKLASKKSSAGGSLWKGRHKDICGVLGIWRKALRLEDQGYSACSWYDFELLAFLQAQAVLRILV